MKELKALTEKEIEKVLDETLLKRKKKSKNRRHFTMTYSIFRRIVAIEGKEPRCVNCGRILFPNMLVFSKATRSASLSSTKVKRYCEDCRRKLKIWIH